MADSKEEFPTLAGFRIDDAVEAVRSEPAAAWFLAQLLWTSEPFLGLIWPAEKIDRLAERLESAIGPREKNPKAEEESGSSRRP
jgi:hypothetical protein